MADLGDFGFDYLIGCHWHYVYWCLFRYSLIHYLWLQTAYILQVFRNDSLRRTHISSRSHLLLTIRQLILLYKLPLLPFNQTLPPLFFLHFPHIFNILPHRNFFPNFFRVLTIHKQQFKLILTFRFQLYQILICIYTIFSIAFLYLLFFML